VCVCESCERGRKKQWVVGPYQIAAKLSHAFRWLQQVLVNCATAKRPGLSLLLLTICYNALKLSSHPLSSLSPPLPPPPPPLPPNTTTTSNPFLPSPTPPHTTTTTSEWGLLPPPSPCRSASRGVCQSSCMSQSRRRQHGGTGWTQQHPTHPTGRRGRDQVLLLLLQCHPCVRLIGKTGLQVEWVRPYKCEQGN